MQQIIIGCDDAAVVFKNEIRKFLEKSGYAVEDVGVFEESDTTFYPQIAAEVCKKIIDSSFCKKGILICGTGIGMAITANKYKGIRAAVCHDRYSVQRSRRSNDCNVICMGARIVGLEYAKLLVSEWLTLPFHDGKSTPKIEKIREIEQHNMK